ncbi:hypothetical protein CCP3SC1_140045 [Gammaproteobacteria bacterium]
MRDSSEDLLLAIVRNKKDNHTFGQHHFWENLTDTPEFDKTIIAVHYYIIAFLSREERE